eukprot:170488_1
MPSKWISIYDKTTLWYFTIWFLLLITIVCMTFILLYYIGNMIINKASYSIFAKTLINVLKCNTLFFDVIPRGHLLNILSTDPNTVDVQVPVNLFYALLQISTLVGQLMMITIIAPTILLTFIVFVFPICFIIYRKVKKSYYSLTVLWKNSLSPILSLFEESITGLDSIRAYKLEKYFLNLIKQRIDTVCKCKYNAQSVLAWCDLYLNVVLQFCLLISIIIFCWTLLYFNYQQDINLVMLAIWWYMCIAFNLLSGIIAEVTVHAHVSSIQKMFFYCNNDKNIDDIYKSQKQKKKK